ncbi:hypothetical protein ABTI12_20205, partial [Acinetobacter baumannii]
MGRRPTGRWLGAARHALAVWRLGRCGLAAVCGHGIGWDWKQSRLGPSTGKESPSLNYAGTSGQVL